MELFHILHHIRTLADNNGIKLSPSEMTEIVRILLCPAEREYAFEDDASLLKLIKRIKQGGGVIRHPLIDPTATWKSGMPLLHAVAFYIVGYYTTL